MNGPKFMSVSQPQSILIVDAEPIYQIILAGALGEYGFYLLTAFDGKGAFNRAKETRPDLILLDVMLPGLSGFEVCVLLKSEPMTRHIPVIFVSALTDTEQKLQAFHLGGADYITKPFDCREVLARVTVHLDQHRICQQLRQRLDAYESEDRFEASPEYHQTKRAKSMVRVANHLRHYLDATPCLDQLAKLANTNRTSLNHDFHQVYGMSVFDWLREQRLVRAAQLLMSSDIPVLEIAQSVGYANHASFCKAFHQRFSQSPREYREPHPLTVWA
jgi:DNA-binding response OmpR family regulator